MANNYKFKGVALAKTTQTNLVTAGTGETLIIKSVIITNNTANTPTVSLDVTDSSPAGTFTILRTHALTANTSEELLTKPLVLEAGDILKMQTTQTNVIKMTASVLQISRS